METCPKNYICPISPSIAELLPVTQKLIASRSNTAGQIKSLEKLILELSYQETRCLNGDPLSCIKVKALLLELIIVRAHEDHFISALKSIGNLRSMKVQVSSSQSLTNNPAFR